MLDIRKLLTKYHIHWIDKGENCSKWDVNVNCVFCRKTSNPDPSHHLGIGLDGSGYHCLRNSRHTGPLVKLLQELRIPPKEYENLRPAKAVSTETNIDRDYSAFQYFLPATLSNECLQYLAGRGFSNPEKTCDTFNFKFIETGKWAGRLLIPLTIGWTGRSIRSHVEPRYKAWTDEVGFFEYGRSTSCIIQEGVLDSARLATVSKEYCFIATCGLERLTAALIYVLRERRFHSIFYVPDRGVDFLTIHNATNLLRSYCVYSEVKAKYLPEGVKDSCEMSEREARRWILQLPMQFSEKVNKQVY